MLASPAPWPLHAARLYPQVTHARTHPPISYPVESRQTHARQTTFYRRCWRSPPALDPPPPPPPPAPPLPCDLPVPNPWGTCCRPIAPIPPPPCRTSGDCVASPMGGLLLHPPDSGREGASGLVEDSGGGGRDKGDCTPADAPGAPWRPWGIPPPPPPLPPPPPVVPAPCIPHDGDKLERFHASSCCLEGDVGDARGASPAPAAKRVWEADRTRP